MLRSVWTAARWPAYNGQLVANVAQSSCACTAAGAMKAAMHTTAHTSDDTHWAGRTRAGTIASVSVHTACSAEQAWGEWDAPHTDGVTKRVKAIPVAAHAPRSQSCKPRPPTQAHGQAGTWHGLGWTPHAETARKRTDGTRVSKVCHTLKCKSRAQMRCLNTTLARVWAEGFCIRSSPCGRRI